MFKNVTVLFFCILLTFYVIIYNPNTLHKSNTEYVKHVKI